MAGIIGHDTGCNIVDTDVVAHVIGTTATIITRKCVPCSVRTGDTTRMSPATIHVATELPMQIATMTTGRIVGIDMMTTGTSTTTIGTTTAFITGAGGNTNGNADPDGGDPRGPGHGWGPARHLLGGRPHRSPACVRLTLWGLTVVVLSGLGGTALFAQETALVNRVVTRLTEGKPVIGTFSRGLDPGLDFLVIDAQYGEFDPEAIRLALNDLRGDDAPPRLAPVVRIPYDARAAPNDAVDAVLAAGALGVMFPDIETPGQAQTVVAAMRYREASDAGGTAAVGQRDRGVGSAARYWGLSDEAYRARADVWPLHPSGALVAMLQIESRMGVERVDEILDTPGIGVIFLGPTDLARSIGAAGPNAPEVETLVQRVLRACLSRDIPCGYPVVAATPEEAERETARRLREGFTVLAVMTLSG